VIGRWLSPVPPVSSTNKTDRHNITELLLKVALITIKQSNKQTNGNVLLTRIALWILNISKLNNKLGKQLNKFCHTSHVLIYVKHK
jgi:hypothetical protein